MKLKVKCPHCKYSWNTSVTDKVLVTCVSCNIKFKVKECIVK